ncbi:unnamed protein product [Didymodactylos carnosus]|uniref:Testis-expressed sequence 9 protein n=1 Tax=Didymodactylos carnosus TaxID=1234261 RepID=A0A813NGR1_9BILA|nr:unnamed protein product [Didymodactylos carnosus]CAF3517486.1 unnamed protein product [Didymodactylos carnosus]
MQTSDRSKPVTRTPSATQRNENVSRPDLADQEEEYKQLEAKTAALVEEAEQVLRNQDKLLNEKPAVARNYSLLDQVDTDDIYDKFQPKIGDGVAIIDDKQIDYVSIQAKAKTTFDKTVYDIETKVNQRDTNKIFNSYSNNDDENDDVLPAAAKDMGTEAKIRFLKARLRVMQEELERMHTECIKRVSEDMHADAGTLPYSLDDENEKLTIKMKETDDERSRLSRVITSLQDQLEKHKKLSTDSKTKLDTTEIELSSVKKEIDQMKRQTKKQSQEQNQSDTKLNRALEEAERYKQQLQKMQSTTKDLTEQDKKKIEQLTNENRKLEKQRLELMNAFKRQLKLIDVLKKQKLHLEASKLLQFTEEEFVKAIEWNVT